MANSDSYNGAVTDKYAWSQTMNDVDIQIPVPKEIKKGKDIKVIITAETLEVRLLSSGDPLVSGKLTYPVNKEESSWSLSPGESISIFLQKGKGRWWTAVLEGEEPIDPKSIEAVQPMHELPEEEQAKLQELIYNQEQKVKGLPTSEEQKLQNILKKAWDAEGSPFKGQPYDPSLVTLGSDDIQIPPDV